MSAIAIIDQRIEQEKQSGKFLYKIDEFLDTELTLGRNITANLSVWISCFLLVVSCCLYIPAFATTEWGVAKEVDQETEHHWNYGLWEYCGGDVETGCRKIENLTSAYVCCQAFATLALIGLFANAVLLILYCLYDHMKMVPLVRIGVFISRLSSALFLMLTFSIYAPTWYKPIYDYQRYETSLSYSYGLTITAFCLESIATALMGIEMKHQSVDIELDRQQQLSECNVNQSLTYSDSGASPNNNNRGMAEIETQSKITSPYELYKEFSNVMNADVNNDSINDHYEQYDNNKKDENRYFEKHPNQINNHKRNEYNERVSDIDPQGMQTEVVNYSVHRTVDSNYKQSAHGKTGYEKGTRRYPKHQDNTKVAHDKGYNEVSQRNGQQVNSNHFQEGHNKSLNSEHNHIHRQQYNNKPQRENSYAGDNLDKTKTLNPSFAVEVDVHHNLKINTDQKNSAPKRPSRRRSHKNQSHLQEDRLHSYENIPDGQVDVSSSPYAELNISRHPQRNTPVIKDLRTEYVNQDFATPNIV